MLFLAVKGFSGKETLVGPEFQRFLSTSKTIQDTTEKSVPAHIEQILISWAVSKMSIGFMFLKSINIIYQLFNSKENSHNMKKIEGTALRDLGELTHLCAKELGLGFS